MSVQMIELEAVSMVEVSDDALEATAVGALTAYWRDTCATAQGCGAYCL